MRGLVAGLLAALTCLPGADAGARSLSGAVRVATQGLRSTTVRLASDRLQGRDNDTPGSFAAQKYLVKRLRRLGGGGIVLSGTTDPYRQHFTSNGQNGTNLLALIPGSDLPNEYVIVGAHYDHLDTRSTTDGHCRSQGTPGGKVCNGATDNATGVAAVLAIGKALRALPQPTRRSVILALWDSEEDGLVGSAYFTANPVVPLAEIKAYVNFDILGADLLPSVRNVSFAVGAETGGATLQAIVDGAVGAQSLDVQNFSFVFGQLRSDYANFVAAGVPTIFFSDSTGGCYHTTGDDLRIVDFKKLRQQSAIAFRTTLALANSATPPTFVPPNPALAVYGDALSLAHVLGLGFPADLHFFSAEDQARAQAAKADLDRIVAEGTAAFDAADVTVVVNTAVTLINALVTVPCQRF
jgi:hypothetical protein